MKLEIPSFGIRFDSTNIGPVSYTDEGRNGGETCLPCARYVSLLSLGCGFVGRHQPSPIRNASITAVPLKIVPRISRRHQKYAVATSTA